MSDDEAQPVGDVAPAAAAGLGPGRGVLGAGGGVARDAAPRAPLGGPRIVTGVGLERVENVPADERRRNSEGARRGRRRSDEGTRGMMVGFEGQQLDRSAGVAWHVGRRCGVMA